MEGVATAASVYRRGIAFIAGLPCPSNGSMDGKFTDEIHLIDE